MQSDVDCFILNDTAGKFEINFLEEVLASWL